MTFFMPCFDVEDDAETVDYCSTVHGYRQLDDDRITVLANGLWTRLDESGQAISVLDNTDLRSVQGPDIGQALQRIPGVSISRNGGLGSFTGISVRGAASDRVLVLVDGVRVNDVAGPSGGFDFGSVMAGSVERVELLRGSNSLIWGSDALGGIVHLTTRTVDGVVAEAEYGGDDQVSGSFAAGKEERDFAAGITASYVTREGFSSSVVGSENDGFEQLALSARGHVEFIPEWTVFASARFADGYAEIDGFPAPNFVLADTAERQDMRQISGRGGIEYSGDFVTVTAALAHAESTRDLVDELASVFPYYSISGRSTRADAAARIRLSDTMSIITGADHEWTRFSDGFTAASAEIGSGHAALSYAPDHLPSDLHLSAGVRYDRHSDFGAAWSFGANGLVELAEHLRMRASWGEGFKAPSLFQLHSDFGNLSLSPERSSNVDVGLDFDSGTGWRASLTLFRRDSTDLIDFVSCFGVNGSICTDRPFGTYDNVGRARSQGAEIEGHLPITEGLEAGIAYSFIHSENRETGNDLARRPRNALTFSSDWEVVQGVALGADLRVVSSSFDNAANTVRLGGYEVLTLRARWEISDQFELFGRVENALDDQYQTAAGYAAQGRAAYIGARAQF